MKNTIITTILLFSLLAGKSSDAQISLNVNLNIGSQPDWGPVGYDHVDYYYLPEIQTYYDVPAHQYVYYENNSWVRRSSLPVRYRNYDMYRNYKVVINERSPWERNSTYKTRYNNYAGKRGQLIIRDSRDAKYAKHWYKKGEQAQRKEQRNQDKNWRNNDKQSKRNDRHDD